MKMRLQTINGYTSNTGGYAVNVIDKPNMNTCRIQYIVNSSISFKLYQITCSCRFFNTIAGEKKINRTHN